MAEKQITLAFDGIGGCGKTHAIEELSRHLSNLGYRTLKAKVSGLGSSPRAQHLKDIHNYREGLLREGIATPKQIKDKQLDRVHRLATRHQIRMLSREFKGNNYDFVLLDRTPMMLWAYSASRDETNPYLDELLRDSINQTLELNTNGIYFLEVDPMEVIARRLARDLSVDYSNEAYRNMIRRFGINPQQADTLLESVHERRASGKAKSQILRECDFVPYEQLIREQSFFLSGFAELEKYGAHISIINANQPLTAVVESITHSITTEFLVH